MQMSLFLVRALLTRYSQTRNTCMKCKEEVTQDFEIIIPTESNSAYVTQKDFTTSKMTRDNAVREISWTSEELS